jgi:hypothetical protein
MLSLQWLLKSHKFNRMWSAVSTQLASTFTTGELLWTGPDFDAEIRYGYVHGAAIPPSNEGLSCRKAVWRACFVYSGFAGLTQLARSGLGEFGKPVGNLDDGFARRMTDLWKSLSASDNNKHLKRVVIQEGRPHKIADWPDMMSDLKMVLVFRDG